MPYAYFFCDSDYETWNMDPNAIEAAFEEYGDIIKVVLVLHLHSSSADVGNTMYQLSRMLPILLILYM